MLCTSRAGAARRFRPHHDRNPADAGCSASRGNAAQGAGTFPPGRQPGGPASTNGSADAALCLAPWRFETASGDDTPRRGARYRRQPARSSLPAVALQLTITACMLGLPGIGCPCQCFALDRQDVVVLNSSVTCQYMRKLAGAASYCGFLLHRSPRKLRIAAGSCDEGGVPVAWRHTRTGVHAGDRHAGGTPAGTVPG